jgi:hypothetical protein
MAFDETVYCSFVIQPNKLKERLFHEISRTFRKNVSRNVSQDNEIGNMSLNSIKTEGVRLISRYQTRVFGGTVYFF